MPNTPIHLTDREDHVLLVAEKAGDSVTITADRLSQAREIAVYALWSKEAMGGTFVIETAHQAGYPGHWQELGELAWAAADSVQQRAISGVHLALRIRLIDDVVGGTVTLYGIAN